jgi:hypothetical protein
MFSIFAKSSAGFSSQDRGHRAGSEMFQENVWEGGKEGGGDATRPRRREGGHRTLARPGAGGGPIRSSPPPLKYSPLAGASI